MHHTGDVQEARRCLPAEIEAFISRSPGNTFWIGVLLIKTGETETAITFFNNILTLSKPRASDTPGLRHVEAGMQAIQALATTAAELIRQTIKVKSWQTDVDRALIDLLIHEPDGSILLPIRDALAAIPPHQ